MYEPIAMGETERRGVQPEPGVDKSQCAKLRRRLAAVLGPTYVTNDS